MEKNTEQKVAAANERMLRMQQARMLLTEEVRLLLQHNENEQLRWKGTTIDLMEALYDAFEQQTITDDYGIPVAFREMARRCCQLLGVKLPSNPYEAANRGRQRKGVKNLSYMKRYLLMTEKGCRNVLWNSISPTIA